MKTLKENQIKADLKAGPHTLLTLLVWYKVCVFFSIQSDSNRREQYLKAVGTDENLFLCFQRHLGVFMQFLTEKKR